MNVTLTEKQTRELIKKYYEEVEKTQVEVQFSKYQDDPFIEITPVISKEIVLGGIKLTASEEVSMMKMTEIFNHYLPTDYSFKKASFSIHKEYDRPGDYIEYVNTSVEFEPVDQKIRERRL